MRDSFILLAILSVGAAWGLAVIGMALFIFEGDRFTATDGQLLEIRIVALEGVQTEHLPVMGWIKPKADLVQTGDKVNGNFRGFKQRPCDRVPDSEVGYYKRADGIEREAGFQYVEDKTPASSFSSDVIFDIGGIEWSGVKDPVMVGFKMKHLCNNKPESSEFWFNLPSASTE